MTDKTKQRIKLAYLNASEMIRGHVEIGLFPDDVDEDDEKGLQEYKKACERVAKKLEKLAQKIK